MITYQYAICNKTEDFQLMTLIFGIFLLYNHVTILSHTIISHLSAAAPKRTCFPNPCGPNSQCRELNGRPTCSCLPSYLGSPPRCRPECTIHSDCLSHLACVGLKCVDPCPGSCGQNADCRVYNHNPICSCRRGHTGDAYALCTPIPRKLRIHFAVIAKNFLISNN